ncbi:efflux RND transporter periplasmic adaptor subunit [Dyella caseinilytica]|uniref:Efflux RND transporter periplasmic adaptor subunit n=1 Tax=Dyella caseinilytica TaxID=1849581 RepID=A0ABX7GXW5_9GAMM|nr:efflux RND transporter periplasmic adaptor subunit [Dyella caseinilytica]QRN54868.1 efflux RND transporter periplasmic adaptor subunit [Dyella caseinilytica]GFZ97524.1 cobalt transporter [Dyella caseinilytica]
MKRVLITSAAAFLAALLLVIGYLSGRHTSSSSMPSVAATSKMQDKKVLYWYDTMVPDQHFNHPGLSPMGMKMVPRYADEGADPNVIRIDPATVQNLGIRTAPVEHRVLASVSQVPGTVTWDLRQASTVSARVDGVISQLYVRAPYTTITAGEPLATMLAPEWNSALAEYSALQQAQSSDAKALRAAARQRLDVLGLADADIRSAHGGSNGGITLHALASGVVTTLDVREGQRVTAGQTLMTVNGLSTVWVEAALPQAIAGTVWHGTPVTVTVDALPGHEFHGTVETLLPDIDAMTRTQRARIVLSNEDGALSPGMFASVRVAPANGEAVPVVPSDALITSGSEARVIVVEGNGHFHPVSVRTGRSSEGYTEILAGLQGNEKVVVSGQFLIDSEASLSGALDRLDTHPSRPASAASTSMPAMRMGDQP